MVVAQTITYRRSLNPLQRFDLVTRVLGFDAKAVYVEQTFRAGGRIHAHAVVRARFLKRSGGSVTVEELQQLTGRVPEGVRLPDWVWDWSQRLLRNKGTETDDTSDPQTRQQWAKVLLLTVKGLQPACRTPAEASRTSGANRQRTGRRGRRRCGCPVTGLLSGPDLADLTWRHSSCLIGPEGE